MSKNITIQEGGVGRQFTADKLKTALVGGGSCLWVPEDEVKLSTLHVTENGTYSAADDGGYGYSQVTVNVPGGAGGDPGGEGCSIVGTNPDTGNDELVTVEDGKITTTELPHSIRVETPPATTEYADGDAIDFSGMVVRAYLKSGGVWSDASHPNGMIPIGELTLPVTMANKGEGHSEEWTDGTGIDAMLISYTEHWNAYWDVVHNRPDPSRDYPVYLSQVIGGSHGCPAMWGSNGGPTQFWATIYNGEVYIWGATEARRLNGYYDSGEEYFRYSNWMTTTRDCGSGELVRAGTKDAWITGIPESTKRPTGKETLFPVDARQTIPVQWARPGDGSQLETGFDISVT